MYETIDYAEVGDTATITLRRPRINVRQIRELERVLDHLEDFAATRVLVLRGSSQGIDFADFDPREPLDIHGFNKWEKLVNRLERLEKITVAAADGPCVGGGFQLLLACDLRVCTRAAAFALPEVNMGFLPGMATFRLAKYVGLGHAKRIIISGATLGPDEALALGLVDHVVDDLDAGIAAAVSTVAAGNVVAATLARRLLNESYGAAVEDAIGHFLAAQHRALNQSAFLQTLAKEQKKS